VWGFALACAQAWVCAGVLQWLASAMGLLYGTELCWGVGCAWACGVRCGLGMRGPEECVVPCGVGRLGRVAWRCSVFWLFGVGCGNKRLDEGQQAWVLCQPLGGTL
jgi:hypothetical protein